MTRDSDAGRSDSGGSSRRSFLKLSGAAGTLGITGLSGCLGGGGGGSDGGGSTPTPTSGDGGGSTPTSGSEPSGPEAATEQLVDEYDFGGEELNVFVNLGNVGGSHKRHLIPEFEEKYNVTVNTTTGVTTQMLTKLEANPNNPPDVMQMDVIGVQKATVQNDWLAPITEFSDLVPHYENIHPKFKHYEDTGVSWNIGEVAPVLNTNMWDSVPGSWGEIISNSSATGLVPFSWSAGPYLLLMASAIAQEKDFSSQLDPGPGFQYLEENLAPDVSATFQGVASAKQQLASGNWDTLNMFWDYMVYDMFLNQAPIAVPRRLDPAGIPYAATVEVASGSSMKEAAMLYVNEACSPSFQTKMSGFMGAGVTNTEADVAPPAQKYDVPTVDTFDQLQFPDFGYIWENRDQWSERWSEIFSK